MNFRILFMAMGVITLSGAGVAPAQDQRLSARACLSMEGRQLEAQRIGLPTGGVLLTGAAIVPATEDQPGHCRIEGEIAPVDPQAPVIEFAVVAPVSWNGGSWHRGGGGVNGRVPGLTGSGTGATPPGSPSLLSQGFAVYGGDSGHQGQATDWVRNRESWMNFAYEQLKKTNDAAQAVLEELYGRKASTRYFSGTSQGGREALEVVARYPEDYEGVLSVVPLAYFQGLLIDPTIKVLSQSEPGAWIPPTKNGLLTGAVLDVCDDMDGREDGLISNYAACAAALDPTVTQAPLSALRCPTGADEGDHCLSSAQLRMFNSLHGPVAYDYVLPNGWSDWPGWGPGADTSLLSRTQPDPASGDGPFGIGAGVQRQAVGGSSDFNLYDLSPDTHRPVMERLSRELDVPADWSAFFSRGGRLIMVTAAADTISNPRAQMRLFDEVRATNGAGAVERSVRYYVVPNAPHVGPARTASGETMPGSWDPVSALRNWVERGEAPPDSPVLADYQDGAIVATWPLCRYPQYPHFTGGDPDDASAYVCRAP